MRHFQKNSKLNQTMKISIDLKSALCGLAIGVAVMFLTGAGTSSNPTGKYKISTVVSEGKGFVVMVDTQTGEAWGCECHPNQMARESDFWKQK